MVVEDERFEKSEKPTRAESNQAAMDEVMQQWFSQGNIAQKNSESTSDDFEVPDLQLTDKGGQGGHTDVSAGTDTGNGGRNPEARGTRDDSDEESDRPQRRLDGLAAKPSDKAPADKKPEQPNLLDPTKPGFNPGNDVIVSGTKIFGQPTVYEYDFTHRKNSENLKKVTVVGDSKTSEFENREDGLKRVEESGQTKVSRFANRADGLKTEVNTPDSRTREFSGRSDKVTTDVEYRTGDKTRYTAKSDGSSETRYKDGRVVKVNPDGSSEIQKNGKVTKLKR